jgi:hypothetical protein
MVILPETTKLNPAKVNEVAVVVVNVILAHSASAVRVTLKPPSMVTTSPATGAEAPEAPPEVEDQVDVDDQFPDATENLDAPILLVEKQAQKIKSKQAEINLR